MSSDFSVTWQFISKRTIVFLLQHKLHAGCKDFLCTKKGLSGLLLIKYLMT
jgi:hypothetical protein